MSGSPVPQTVVLRGQIDRFNFLDGPVSQPGSIKFVGPLLTALRGRRITVTIEVDECQTPHIVDGEIDPIGRRA
jgi:hypothetical protein